jgi:hypothetical protein
MTKQAGGLAARLHNTDSINVVKTGGAGLVAGVDRAESIYFLSRANKFRPGGV